MCVAHLYVAQFIQSDVLSVHFVHFLIVRKLSVLLLLLVTIVSLRNYTNTEWRQAQQVRQLLQLQYRDPPTMCHCLHFTCWEMLFFYCSYLITQYVHVHVFRVSSQNIKVHNSVSSETLSQYHIMLLYIIVQEKHEYRPPLHS